jgi:pimeloyl-[acyl-carrier protein] methyl ester esterase
VLNADNSLYAIPGWGFSADIFNCLLTDVFDINGLDYVNAPTSTFESMVNYLSTDIPDNSALVAWSFGGLLAIKLAILFPNKIKKLILISSQPRFLADKDWQGIDVAYANKFIFRFARDANKQIKRFVSLVGQPDVSIEGNEVLINYFLSDHIAKLSSQLSMLFKNDLREEYKNLSCDVLHVFNQKDAVLNQNSHQLLALNSKVETITLEDSGHAGFISQSQIYQKLIREFIS